jgi:hypothetical protein
MKLGVLCALCGSSFFLFLNRQERQVREEALGPSFYLTSLAFHHLRTMKLTTTKHTKVTKIYVLIQPKLFRVFRAFRGSKKGVAGVRAQDRHHQSNGRMHSESSHETG